jgi:hypothetical protein
MSQVYSDRSRRKCTGRKLMKTIMNIETWDKHRRGEIHTLQEELAQKNDKIKLLELEVETLNRILQRSKK